MGLSFGTYEYTTHLLLHKGANALAATLRFGNKGGRTFQRRSGFMSARIVGHVLARVLTSRFEKPTAVDWSLEKCAICLCCTVISFRKERSREVRGRN